MSSESIVLSHLSSEQLAQRCQSWGEPAFRAKQIRHWLFRGRVRRFDQMTNLPRTLRHRLEEQARLFSTTVVQHHRASDGTEKLLLELQDGARIECVLMRDGRRRTICVSTQVGCAMGCVFCASGLNGLTRNLTSGEILDQVLALDRLLNCDEQITNVVVMGMGEPLANLKSLLPVLQTLHDAETFGLGARRVTISTVGIPDRMRELARVGRPYKLAVSLHAPNDALRDQLVPVNRGTGIEAILEAADEYAAHTGRRITYEYVLLAEVNDAPRHALQLAALLAKRHAHVNLIPMNPVAGLPFSPPSPRCVERFAQILQRAGIRVTVRKRKGDDISAACGQLRLHQAIQPSPC